MRKSISGFTIVELLIVVVVIAILAAITIVSYNGITARANDSSVRAGLSSAAKKLTTDAQIAPDAACYTGYQEISVSCLESSATFTALGKMPLAKNNSDVIRYYTSGDGENLVGTPTIAAKSASGKYFLVKNGSLNEITEDEYLATNAASFCGATATYSTVSNSWSQEPHYC